MTGPLFEARWQNLPRTLAMLVSESISVSFPAQESAESQSLFSPPLSGLLGSVSVGTSLASAVSGPGGACLPLSGGVGSDAGTAAAMSGVRASAISSCRARSSFGLGPCATVVLGLADVFPKADTKEYEKKLAQLETCITTNLQRIADKLASPAKSVELKDTDSLIDEIDDLVAAINKLIQSFIVTLFNLSPARK